MRRIGLLILLLSLPLCSGCGFGDRKDVLLLVRSGDPVSRAIAEAFADLRNIKNDQILELTLSGEPGAVEIDAATYLNEIALPIERHLAVADPDGHVSILVTTDGLPLRIGHCDRATPHYPVDCASAAVDAALAQLGRTGDATQPFHRIENPFFREPRSFEEFREAAPHSALRFLVARLSGGSSPQGDDHVPLALHDLLHRPVPDPTPGEAPTPLWRVLAEQPPNERPDPAAALLDPIRERLPLFGHRVCDRCEDLAEDSIVAGVILQSGAPDLASPPRLAHPGVVIEVNETAIGGPGARRAGSAFDRFITRWQALGAGAISTHIGEPSLAGVTRPTSQLIALAEGSSSIEAHFKSVPLLGGVNVFVGDPLLRLADESISTVAIPDHDRDGVPDSQDNCRDDPNPNQLDTNADGIGNLCDPDVDNDGDVDTSWGAIYPVDQRGDLQAIALTARNGPYDPSHDFDGDGRVDERDLVRAQLWLFRSPGQPSQQAVLPSVPDAQ